MTKMTMLGTATVLAGWLALPVGAGTPLYKDDFNSGALNPDWTYESGTWKEKGGKLLAAGKEREARAVSSPDFSGCDLCAVEALLKTGGGKGNRVSLIGWHEKKGTEIELQMRDDADRWLLRQRVDGKTVAIKAANGSIKPGRSYRAKMTFDGNVFQAFVDGRLMITMPKAKGTLPYGTAGFMAKHTDGSYDNLIIDRMVGPGISVSDSSVIEGHRGTTPMVFTVSLSSPRSIPVSVDYATNEGTAGTTALISSPLSVAGPDYSPVSGTLTIPAGSTSQTFSVPVNGDTTYEGDETFIVKLNNPVDATISDGQGTGTIQNDDVPPSAWIDDVTITEPASGSANAVFTVSLSAASELPASFDFATQDDTATSGPSPTSRKVANGVPPGPDYTNTSGTVTIPAGATTATISIPVLSDQFSEKPEDFFVNLSNPTNATLLDAQGIGTVLDKGEPPEARDDHYDFEPFGQPARLVSPSEVTPTLDIPAPGVLQNDTLNGASISAYDATTSDGGSVTLNADGSFSYSPPQSFEGDSFTYTLTNGSGNSTASVYIEYEVG